MNTSIKFERSEGFALAAAFEAYRSIFGVGPVLDGINPGLSEGDRCHLVCDFADGATVQVLLSGREGWVRVFPPDWIETRRFRQASLTALHSGLLDRPTVSLGTLHIVPLAELHWEELPHSLRTQIARWL